MHVFTNNKHKNKQRKYDDLYYRPKVLGRNQMKLLF